MKRTILTLISALTCLLFISCGGGGGSSSPDSSKSFVKITLGGSGKPNINSEQGTGFRENSIPSNIYKLSFTISASDMTTANKDVLVAGQTAVTETFSIQNGTNRYFLVEAKDSSGTTLYKGDTTVTLDGIPVTLNINMVAQDTGGTTTTTTTATTTTTTTTTSDTTAPTVSSVSPASGATGVSISTTITATFSEAMDSSSITTSTFTVSGVSGTVTYSGTTATFTPSSSLSYSTTYTATITTGVKDSAGNAMASSYTWSFSTGSTPDTTAPTVSSVSPASGATGVSISTTITATFSEAMDSSTINTSTFSISGVSGTVTYSGTTATWTPSSSLSYSTPYTATITTGVTDSAGNAMANSYSWSWTTGSAPDTTAPSSPSVSINSGAASTTSTSVTLTLSATDSVGVTGYYASESSATPSASASGWTAVTSTTSYSANVSFTLSSGSGTKTVYVWFKDSAENVSDSASDSIFLTISLPKTGQTTVYSTDDDGTLQKGVTWPSPRFTAGTGAEANCITDNLTGLMWVKSPDGTTRTWANALTYANDLSLCGYTDWRLPNVNELESLINAEQSNPATWLNGQGFSNVQGNIYWSSTTTPLTTSRWDVGVVQMANGYVDYLSKTNTYYVLPVRAGQGEYSATVDLPETGQTTCYDSSGSVISCTSTGQDGDIKAGTAWSSPRFTVGTGAEANCITDNLTGLMWVKSPDSTTRTWANALTYANDLSLCGYTDWRLPNRKELKSLINYEQNPASWLNTQGFSNVQGGYYHSSTTVASSTLRAWGINMVSGYVYYGYAKTEVSSYVLPVRAGQ